MRLDLRKLRFRQPRWTAWECGNATPLWRSVLFASRQSHHLTATALITNRSMHPHELSKKPLTSTPNDRSRPDTSLRGLTPNELATRSIKGGMTENRVQL